MKPGILTTEFWVTLMTQLAGALLAAGVISPDAEDPWVRVLGLVAMAIAGGAYSASRGLAKQGGAG